MRLPKTFGQAMWCELVHLAMRDLMVLMVMGAGE